MSSKEGTCFRILKKYGLMIDGPEDMLANLKRLPAKQEETFKQWKIRLFSENSEEITVYVPYTPRNNTQMSTIVRDYGGEHLKKVFLRYGKFKDKKRKDAIEETEQDVIERLSTFPKETLASLMDEFEEELQPSVVEFLERYINATDEDIDTEDLLRDLLKTYNNAVTQFRNNI